MVELSELNSDDSHELPWYGPPHVQDHTNTTMLISRSPKAGPTVNTRVSKYGVP